MLRSYSFAVAFVFSSALLAQDTPEKPAEPAVDQVSQQATQLEGQLGKFNDAAPEAADIMVQLVDLYHQHGRVFGLIRSGQRFVNAHPTDERHKAVMLKLIDGLEAASRNEDFTVYARQFLTRYTDAAECPAIEQRLAGVLDRMGKPDKTAEAYRAIWRRSPVVANRHAGFLATARFAAGNAANITEGAELATEMLQKLPVGDFSEHIGVRAFWEYRRISQWAKSNVVGNALIAKGLPRKPEDKWTLHRYMAENYWNQSQHANAVVSIKAAQAIKPDKYLHYQLIERMYNAGAKAAELEPVVNQYFQRYPDATDRFSRRILIGMAHMRETNNPQAAQVFAAALPFDAVSSSAATYYVRTNGSEPAQLAQTERTLLDAISKNTTHAAYLRYVLAFEVYRDRLKDVAKARSVCRDLLSKSPANNSYDSNSISYLLSTVANDQEFQADWALILEARRDNFHMTNLRSYPGSWVKSLRKTKDADLKRRAEYAAAQLQKADTDPIVVKWSSMSGSPWNAKQGAIRASLLSPESKRSQTKQMLLSLLGTQAYYYRHYSPGAERSMTGTTEGERASLEPENYQFALNYLVAATDYSPKEVRKEAALNFLKFQPRDNNADIWRRLVNAADANEDEALLKSAYAWIQKAQQQFGWSPTYAASIGDTLLKYKMEAEAVAYWTKGMNEVRNHSESRECSSRLMNRIDKEDIAARTAFAQEMFKHETDYHGRYASWLANYHIAAGNLDAAIAVLRESLKRYEERPFRGWDMYVWDIHYMMHNYRAVEDNTDENKKKLYEVVRDLRVGWPSAQATAYLLEQEAPDARSQMDRLLAYQRVTQKLGTSSHDWDQLFGIAQGAVTRKDYPVAASLLTGMLSNLGGADAGRKQRGRDMVAQCYSRMGSVGLTIDEDSPIAPLLQAALYLRLGDRKLAFETYMANKALFDEHRSEVPIDLLLFIAESHVAAGGDENHDLVEDILKSWQIKNSENAAIDAADKARVQLMLAKNYFQARRYDIARGEYTSLKNQYPDSNEAIEAEFGIGETLMAQKVYDQAEQTFEKLATSRERDVVIRAEFLLGVLAHRRGDRDDAREIFRGVLERVPSIELANQALFNLAEVYGAEERYMDQLNLLRTVGRLGRKSKRLHKPGTALSIVVQDSDLGISRGGSKIPVKVMTKPGGDEETIYLLSGGAGKGLFRADLDTALGAVAKGDGVLQLTGNDVVTCDYPDSFKQEFKHVPLSDVEIRVAADGEFEIASSKIVDEEEETFTQRLEREQREAESEDERVSQGRPKNQIKPGNLVFLRSKDADRDLTNEPDQVVVKLEANSGDQVQISLTETGPHTGVFEGTAQTGELPAGALATDTAIQHSPLMAIDKSRDTYWLSEPDGATPKELTIDMKDLMLSSRVKIESPKADEHSPVRGTLLGSNDGLFWFRLGRNPQRPVAEPAAPEMAQMTRRVYSGNYTSYSSWGQIVSLGKNSKAIEEEPVDGELKWGREEDDEDYNRAAAVIWSGKLVQEREGAARIMVTGYTTAIAIDGELELEVGRGGRTVDVYLTEGTHDITIFAATRNPVQGVAATWARANHNVSTVQLYEFNANDFDLESPAAQIGDENRRDRTKITLTDTSWQFNFPATELRYAKFVVEEYRGEAVAVNNVEIGGDADEDLYIPTEADVLALAQNDVLEIAGGDVVHATYTDEFTQSESGGSRLLTGELQATYYNADISPIRYKFDRQNDGGFNAARKQLKRIDPGERFIVEIVDYDKDETNTPDKIQFQVFVNDGEAVMMTATETEPFSGVFTKEVDTSADEEDGKLQIKMGDRIYCRYIDSQNTFPGHAVPRETIVYVNQPSIGRVRVLETRVQPLPPNAPTFARPQTTYTIPESDDKVSGVALEAPLTVEVIDPDAARDDESSVIVKLITTDGAEVEVECVVSTNFVPPRTVAPGIGNWALEEGRFIGQVILQLGGKDSPTLVPLTADMPRNLTGGPPLDDDSAFNRTLVTKVLNLTGKDIVAATYNDELRPDEDAKEIAGKARLITNGTLQVVDREYDEPVERLHVGEKLFLKVEDADRDSSDERDFAEVVITSELGEKEVVQLQETLAHSGIFTGSFKLKPEAAPTQGNIVVEAPEIESYFGDTLFVEYKDEAASTEEGVLTATQKVPVVVGTDGLVMAFSKTFNDEELAVETKFHIAESYFELFKSHKRLERSDDERSDLQSGRRILREVMEDYPNPKYVPRISYLLGQFAQELEQWDEAIDAYQMILAQYGDHGLAPDSQYKLAQCFELSGDFDQALEEYVTLAATYPKSPLIANVMIRISDHFYKKEIYDVAAQVGKKFLEKFPEHKFASRLAFRVGQCYFKSKDFRTAGTEWDAFAKAFPDDALASDSLFWAGEAYRMGNNNRDAYRRYNRCRWDYPASDAAKYARSRLTLPEMLAQFEADANSLDNE